MLLAWLLFGVMEAQAAQTFSLSVVGGPMVSDSSQKYERKPGILAGVLLDFSPGRTSWEVEILAAARKYETTGQNRIDVIHGQLGAIMRPYLDTARHFSFGIGPYVGKPFTDQDSINSNQFEAGGSLSLRADTGAFANFLAFGIGLSLETRFTAGVIVSGDPKSRYLDASLLAGLRFGAL